MLTFLSCPKPFTGHIGVIQRNAIVSWTRLQPRPRILLFGDEEGTAEICEELQLIHLPEVRRNEHRTPRFDDVLARAGEHALPGPWCFINADIVLLDDFAAAIATVASAGGEFLVVGQRTDLDVPAPMAFGDSGWQQQLRAAIRERGRLHGEDGIDYFVFTPGLFDPVPALLVGRASIDNWLVFKARRRWRRVVDATHTITAVHQNHDYAHHPGGRFGVYHGEEAQANLAAAGGHDHLFWISDRTHRLTAAGIALDLSAVQLRRHWDRLPVLVPSLLRPAVLLVRIIQRRIGDVLRAAGLRKPLQSRQ